MIFLLFLSCFTARCLIVSGWTAVQRINSIRYDLENSPLQIKTNSVDGSDEIARVHFYHIDGVLNAGGVNLYFTSTPQYYISTCTTISRQNFPTSLPTETDRIWTITLSRTSDTVRLIVHCNNKEVLNVVLSETICGYAYWSKVWNRRVGRIRFPNSDTASDFYGPAPDCTGLKTEWTSTMKTTTQFPVNPGTEVEVTCSDTDAVNAGSSSITCITGYIFTFSKEPSCSPPAEVPEPEVPKPEVPEDDPSISVMPVKSKVFCTAGKKKCAVKCTVKTSGILNKKGMKICKLENDKPISCKLAKYRKKEFGRSLGKVQANAAGKYVCNYTEKGVQKSSTPITLTVKPGKKGQV